MYVCVYIYIYTYTYIYICIHISRGPAPRAPLPQRARLPPGGLWPARRLRPKVQIKRTYYVLLNSYKYKQYIYIYIYV